MQGGTRNKCYLASFVIGKTEVKSNCQKLKLPLLKYACVNPLYCQHPSGISPLWFKKKKRGTKPASHQFNDCLYVNTLACALMHKSIHRVITASIAIT